MQCENTNLQVYFFEILQKNGIYEKKYERKMVRGRRKFGRGKYPYLEKTLPEGTGRVWGGAYVALI